MINHRNTKFNTFLLKLFKESDKHYSVSEILKLSKNTFPKLNKTTVYRNIEHLLVNNIVNPVNVGEKTIFYESKIYHHHHIRCVKCNKMISISLDEKKVKSIESELYSKYGYIIKDHYIEFVGKCQKCNSNET